MKSVALLMMIGITLVYSEKHSVQYFRTETTGLPNYPQFMVAGPEQTVMSNISVPKHHFNMTEGVQVWDDQTGATDAFRQEGNDGEDSLSLDLKKKELKVQGLSPVQQGLRPEQKLNNERPKIENINVAKHRFNPTEGVQEGDDQTGATDAFRQEGNDGEDSLSLDLKKKELKVEGLSPVQQGLRPEQKLNNDRPKIEEEELRFSPLCIPSRRRTSK